MITYYVLKTEWKKMPTAFTKIFFYEIPNCTHAKLFCFTVSPKVCPYISVSYLPGSTTGKKPEKPRTVGIQGKIFRKIIPSLETHSKISSRRTVPCREHAVRLVFV